MGIFGLFKKQPILVDDVFGELMYEQSKDPLQRVYKGEVSFDEQKVEILLYANETGPSPEQKQFFRELIQRYPHLKNEVLPAFFERELGDWEADLMPDFDEEFELNNITLQRIAGRSAAWSLSLYSITMNHYLDIEFIDMVPQKGIVFDA